MLGLDRDVQRFIKRLQPKAPVNIVGIAKVLGLQVWESRSLPENVAGKLFIDKQNGGTNGYSIVVRSQDPLVRKRFTVAHEIAHYLLHRHLFIRELVDDALYRSELKNVFEAQANQLAAELLMPWHLLAEVADRPLGMLAKMFEVSEQAMSIRLESGARTALLPQTRLSA